MATRAPSPAPRPGKKAATRLAAGARAPRIRRKAAGAESGMSAITPEERHRLIAEAAYFIAERRGFAAGCELDDWLRAEAEVERRLGAGSARAGTN